MEDGESEDSEQSSYGGRISMLTDAQVAETYELAEILKRLGKSLSDMAEKLPQRLTKIQQKAQLAISLLAALKRSKLKCVLV